MEWVDISPLLGLLPPRNPCGCYMCTHLQLAELAELSGTCISKDRKALEHTLHAFFISLGFPFAKGAAGNRFEEEFGYEI